MKGIKETHGTDLIRRLAAERIKKPGMLPRVWSEEMKCWGFFAEKPNELDVMLVIGCAMSGDMFRLENYGSQLFTVTTCEIADVSQDSTFIVLDLAEFEVQNTMFYGLRLLSSQPAMMCQLLSRQSSIFKIAWDSL